MSLRLTCLVPGCRHTRGQRKGEEPIQGHEEWICGQHWREIPGHTRRRYRAIVRRYHKRFGPRGFWRFPAGSPDRLEAVRLDRMWSTAWRLTKRAAIQRAAGL